MLRTCPSLPERAQDFPGTRPNCLHGQQCSIGVHCIVGVLFGVFAALLSRGAPDDKSNLLVYDCFEEVDVDGTRPACRDEGCRDTGDGFLSCKLRVEKDLRQPMMLMYQLDDLYQNHRRYVSSVSYEQLTRAEGSELQYSDVSTSCSPLISPNENSRSAAPYDPCGLKAASIFDDVVLLIDASGRAIRTSKNITYDYSRTFTTLGNSSGRDWLFGGVGGEAGSGSGVTAAGTTAAGVGAGAADGDATAASAEADAAELGSGPAMGDVEEACDTACEDAWRVATAAGPTPDDMVTWMRASSLPEVRKPLLRIEEDLPAGSYTLRIRSTFDVRFFRGRKALQIAPWGSYGGDHGSLIRSLSALCAIALLLAAVIGTATCFSSQPGRCEELLHELYNLEQQEEREQLERKRSIHQVHMGSDRPTLGGGDSGGGGGSTPALAPFKAQPDGGASSKARGSGRSSQVEGPVVRLGKAADPVGLRHRETDPFERHRAREREILKRYAHERTNGVGGADRTTEAARQEQP